MPKLNLTISRVAALVPQQGSRQTFYWDTQAVGLGVRVGATAASFVFQWRALGKAERLTIGSTKTYTLDQARAEARRLKALTDQGIDPRQQKADRIRTAAIEAEAARQQAAPALVAWEQYLLARKPFWAERSYLDHLTASRVGGERITRGLRKGMSSVKEPGMLRPLLERPLSQIDRKAIAAWVRVEGARRPTSCRRALSLLGAFLHWCADSEEYSQAVHEHATDRQKRALPKPRARTDCLQREQLATWFEYVKRTPNPVARAYLQGLLLTGARSGELARLKWSDVDMVWDVMTIRDKANGQRVIPLTPYFKTLLEGLRRNATAKLLSLDGAPVTPTKPNPYVFAASSASGYIAEARNSHVAALQSAGLPHLTIHGLRRSFGTLAEWCEVPAGITAQVMGHRPSATAEKHYRQRPIDLLRKWHTQIEKWILEQAGIEQPEQTTGQVRRAENGGCG